MVSSCNRVKSFPTAALSTSGIRVEGDSFLSACHTSSPVFNLLIIYAKFYGRLEIFFGPYPVLIAKQDPNILSLLAKLEFSYFFFSLK